MSTEKIYGDPYVDGVKRNGMGILLPPERTFRVFVNAPGWNGSFHIPQGCFAELTSFLAARACAENKI